MLLVANELHADLGANVDAALNQAAEAMLSGNYRSAEATLRDVLNRAPSNPVALRMLGEIAATFGALRHAEALHRRALEIAPDFFYARLHLAITLHDQQRNGEALRELNCITGTLMELPETKLLQSSLLVRVGEYDRAATILKQLTTTNPDDVEARVSLARILTTLGHAGEAVRICRDGLEIAPTEGQLWWALADLKTVEFSDSDLRAMTSALRSAHGALSAVALHFSLGKALGDRNQAAASWAHYERGNSMQAALVPYRPAEIERLVERTELLFTRKLFASYSAGGDPSQDPIFLVGLPRSGSTLVEQILASHSMIEGTAELADIDILARSLQSDPRWESAWKEYPEILTELSDKRLRELGALYLARTKIQRKTDRHYFIDKMPDNWMHIGLIKLILPNAKVIDVRRHPLACGFSNYKQLYARGHAFSYELSRFAAHYKQYLRLMNHFDQVAPGMVHHIIHEQLVADPEHEIRRLLAFIGVPFESGCLTPHKTARPVRTASAEQVRQPIGTAGLDKWRLYERELSALKDSLGSALDQWENV